jgi:hypothetical protein
MSDSTAASAVGNVYRLPWEGEDATTTEGAAAMLEEELPEEDNSELDEPVPEESGEEDTPEDDGDDTSDESEDDEEPEELEEEPAPRYKVKAGGEEIEVSLDELLNGYSRTADYTRKTQQIAEQRKLIESEAEAARGARNEYAQRLELLEQVLAGQGPAEPDWDALRRTDPTEFAVQFAEHQRHQQQMQALQAEKARVHEQQRREYEAGLEQKLIEESQRLVAAIPEWRDENKAKEGKAALLDYARGLGFTDQELDNVYDHRALVLMNKAMLWDKLQKDGVQKVRLQAAQAPQKAPPLKPGSAPQPARKTQAKDQAQRAYNRLSRTGSVNDAARALELLLDD